VVKTQVQLPNDLYRRAKQFAASRELSFAEVIRRGTELLLDVHPGGATLPAAHWVPPQSRDCGWRGLSAKQIRDTLWQDAEPHRPADSTAA
jgi:hypothetical protein